MKETHFARGKYYKNFEITKMMALQELQSTLVQAVHLPTGASVIHIEADDPENLFCLSFQTLPQSSNGVAHILEHTVLCGSKKFPVKDPFFAMMRRSLNTYMNALTGQDFTCYPASSQIEQDFYNLLTVYLDAVFHPELKYLSFLQEGHRLEFVDHHLQFGGVVFNEMKGAMNSLESRLWEELSARLIPDLPYAYNSGGNPKEIPHLTYEELVEFHQSYYHPSRCLFFFYGNLSLERHLDFIENNALQGVEKIAPLPPLPLQTRFEMPVKAKAPYPVAAGEEKDKKAVIAFAWLTTSICHPEKTLALSLLDVMLLETDASPLKMALLKSGLCTSVEASMDLEMSEIPWILVCKGCEEKSIEKLNALIFKTLQMLCSKPFSQELIDASLHQLEFERSEIGGEGVPFGLTLFFRAALVHQHGSDPENALLIHTLFANLKQKCEDPEYLPHLLRESLLENPHFVELILYPDEELEKKEAEFEKQVLKEIENHLTEKKKEKIEKESKELKTYQESLEQQSLECLPKLRLEEIPPHAHDFSLEVVERSHLDVFYHKCFTNKILYADLVFDLPEIEARDLGLVSLFCHLLGDVGCGGKNYEETLHFQQAYTGGVETLLSLHVLQENPQKCRPSLTIRGKALYRNTEKLLTHFSEIAGSSDFTDANRIHEWLLQHATDLKSALSKQAMNYATQLCFSGQSIPSFIHNQWHGIPYYQAVQKWAKKCDQNLLKELQRIQKWVFATVKPHLVLASEEAEWKQLQKNDFYGLSKMANSSPSPLWSGKYTLSEAPSHVRFFASPVAFTAYGIHTVSYRETEAPFLFLAKELLGHTFLHKEIREKGGAYGGGSSYSPSSGNFHFYAYRDPHLAQTRELFLKAIEKIGQTAFTDQELEEAKFSAIQHLDAPLSPGQRAIAAYAWKRAHRTYAHRDQFRQTILSAQKEEVAQAVIQCLNEQKGVFVSFLGKELFEKEKKKLKTPLAILSIEG